MHLNRWRANMLYVNVTRNYRAIVSAHVMTDDEVETHYTGPPNPNAESCNTWRTFEAAREVAAKLGAGYIATDAGAHVSPRYDVIAVPQVGAKVSYAFNGDYYPCGEIASVSKSLKVIVTTEGQKFYRVRETGCWKYNRTWSLVSGHVSKLNPEF